jgi:hypothetical protein
MKFGQFGIMEGLQRKSFAENSESLRRPMARASCELAFANRMTGRAVDDRFEWDRDEAERCKRSYSSSAAIH